MRGTEFTYSRTAQPEKYESHMLSMTYSLDEHDDEKAAVLTVMEQVNLLLGSPNPSPLAGQVEHILQAKVNMGELAKANADKSKIVESKEVDEPKSGTKKKAKSKTTKPKKEAKKSKGSDKVSETEAEETATETPIVSEKSSKEAQPKIEFDAYDRGLSKHKKAFGALLTKVCPEWKEDPEANKVAKSLSISLEGEPMFIKGTFDLLPSFKEVVSSALS